MEEILASIRRIIESNEPQAGNDLQSSSTPVYEEDEEIDITTDVANDPGNPQSSARPESTLEPAVSLADVAARVRAASARQMENGTVRFSPDPVSTLPLQRERGATVPDQLKSVAVRPHLDTPTREVPVASAAPERLDTDFADASAESIAVAAPQSLPAKVEAATGLLSEEAGAQVARSFGELAAVFDGVKAQSLEDMAREMLRPMLQGWLDDNLPTLVERLVREEIERVARGPRN